MLCCPPVNTDWCAVKFKNVILTQNFIRIMKPFGLELLLWCANETDFDLKLLRKPKRILNPCMEFKQSWSAAVHVGELNVEHAHREKRKHQILYVEMSIWEKKEEATVNFLSISPFSYNPWLTLSHSFLLFFSLIITHTEKPDRTWILSNCQ